CPHGGREGAVARAASRSAVPAAVACNVSFVRFLVGMGIYQAPQAHPPHEVPMRFSHPLRRAASVPPILALLGSVLTPVPARAAAADTEVRGYIDAHTHLMSYEAFGGRLMCGKPFDPRGVREALRDCPDHAGNGVFAWWENFTRHGTPFGTHDPSGWPTFE